jgi:hypothetical protein
MIRCGAQRHRTSLKDSLWALKPSANEYSFVGSVTVETLQADKERYLSIYPGSTFKVAKKIPKVK